MEEAQNVIVETINKDFVEVKNLVESGKKLPQELINSFINEINVKLEN